MQIKYPGSFFKLLFVGFLLAVLPLLVGLISDRVAIKRLAAQSQRAVYDASRIAHSSRELNDTAVSLERAAQQNAVLHDQVLWEAYREMSERFVDAGARLASMPLEPEIRGMLEDLLKREAAIHEALAHSGDETVDAAEAADRYALISAGSKALLIRSSSLIDREAESLRQLATETEAREQAQLILLLPLSIFIVAGFTYLLARPINQLNQGIQDLGERRLDAKIVVNGPEDLEKLGMHLDWLRLRLLHLEEQKSQFLRHVSHELKTPLTALREGSELLAEEVAGPLLPRQREIVRILRQNSVELQRLIETLLRHGEAEFRMAAVRRQPVKPGDLIAAVIRRQNLAYAARGIRVTQQVDDFVMHTDAERLRVVLDNLLSNAFKYSPEEGEVTVRAHRQDGQAIIEVIDQGPGVAAEERERIFEPFYRGSADAHGTVQGTGLGLSISRDHILAMGGTIAVGEGRGQFTVTLPLGEA